MRETRRAARFVPPARRPMPPAAPGMAAPAPPVHLRGMKPRVLRAARCQTYYLPSAADEVWEPLWMGHRLMTRFRLMLEGMDPPLTPIGCLVLARIGRTSGLGVSPGRLARELAMPRATLAYHLDALARHQLLYISGLVIHDRRKRRHKLTEKGALALNRAAELWVDLTAGGPWPDSAPRRHWRNLRRLPPDSPADGVLMDDPFPGISRKTPPRPRNVRDLPGD